MWSLWSAGEQLGKHMDQVQILWEASSKEKDQSALLALACSLQEYAIKIQWGLQWVTGLHSYTSSALKGFLPNCRGDRQPFVLARTTSQGTFSLTIATVTVRVMTVGTELPQVKLNQLLWKESSIPSIPPGPWASKEKDLLSQSFSFWLQNWPHW